MSSNSVFRLAAIALLIVWLFVHCITWGTNSWLLIPCDVVSVSSIVFTFYWLGRLDESGRPANLNQLKDGEELYVRERSPETETILCVTQKGLQLFSGLATSKGWKQIVKEGGRTSLSDSNDDPFSAGKCRIRKEWMGLLPHADQIL